MHAEALAAEQDAFATVAATADPDLPVPSCPASTVEALARHTTGVRRWAAAAAGLAADAGSPYNGPYEGAA